MKHEYPSRHQPGVHWSSDQAWEVLDRIEPGAIPDDTRFLLGGMIAGALLRARLEGFAKAIDAMHAKHVRARSGAVT